MSYDEKIFLEDMENFIDIYEDKLSKNITNESIKNEDLKMSKKSLTLEDIKDNKLKELLNSFYITSCNLENTPRHDNSYDTNKDKKEVSENKLVEYINSSLTKK